MIGLIDSLDVEYNGTENEALFKLVCDSAAELSSLTHYDNIKIRIGSECTDIATGDKYLKSSSAWVLQPQSMFANVYTKSEVDSITSAINSDVTTNHAAIAGILNTGSKNKMPTASGQSTPPTRWVNVPVVLPPGTYRVSFGTLASTDTDDTVCQACFLSGSTQVSNWLSFQRGENIVSGVCTITADTTTFRLYPAGSYAASEGDTVSFTDCMICTDADYQVSPDFVEYCPTLAELYAMVRGYHG